MHVNVYFVYVTRRRLIAFDPIGHSLLFPPVPFFIRLRTYLRSFCESLLEIKESREEVKTKSAYRIDAYREIMLISEESQRLETRSTPTPQWRGVFARRG